MSALSTALKNKSADPVPKTIVFCRTKDKACQVYSLLKTASSPGVVSMYHASLTPETKAHTHEQFAQSTVRVLAATVAFGMVKLIFFIFQCGFLQGMDIPDIELVVVLGMPDTIAEFYQVCVST